MLFEYCFDLFIHICKCFCHALRGIFTYEYQNIDGTNYVVNESGVVAGVSSL